MGFLIIMVLLMTLVIGAVLAWHWWQRERLQRIRDRARMRVIEGQMATLRAMLRIQATEYITRQRMQADLRTDPFANDTRFEEYRPTAETWRHP